VPLDYGLRLGVKQMGEPFPQKTDYHDNASTAKGILEQKL